MRPPMLIASAQAAGGSAPIEAPAGCRVRQRGCVHTGVVGGWLIDRASEQPRLVTVAHLLAPRAAVVANTPSMPPLPAVLEYSGDGAVLCVGDPGVPVARVTAAGVCDPYGRVSSLDVAVAAPRSASVVPQGSLAMNLGEPHRGDAVTVMQLDGRTAHGIVVATRWPSRHYGATRDILVAPRGDASLSVAGMSGAWILDASTGTPVAMIVGEVSDRRIGGVRFDTLVCAHPLNQVADRFDLRVATPAESTHD